MRTWDYWALGLIAVLAVVFGMITPGTGRSAPDAGKPFTMPDRP